MYSIQIHVVPYKKVIHEKLSKSYNKFKVRALSALQRHWQTVILLSSLYTECHRRNVPDFGRVFLMLKYTDITQNTYVQS